jgi:monoterpene epsilon-lactone hydrolase
MAFTSRGCGTLEGRWIVIPEDLKDVRETIRLAMEQLGPSAGIEDIRRACDAVYGEMLPLPVGVSFHAVNDVEVRGVWSETPDAVRERVVLYLHGGGYYAGSARSWRPISGEIGRAATVRSFSADYRLAPEHPYPAALDDCMAAYRWLLNQGCHADKLVIAGDSSGAGLAVAVMLRARDAGLPLPAGAYLISPWVDLEVAQESIELKADVDPIGTRAGLEQCAAWYLHGQSARNPLVSPIHASVADLSGFPPVLIHVASYDIMLDEALRLARQFAVADVSTKVEVWPQYFHAFQLWHARLAAARAALANAAVFINDACASRDAALSP